MSIAVKSTGRRGFQEVKEKDLNADYFVWIHFGDWFSNVAGTIEVYILRSPRNSIKAATKLTLDKFKQVAQGALSVRRYASLGEMLRECDDHEHVRLRVPTFAYTCLHNPRAIR